MKQVLTKKASNGIAKFEALRAKVSELVIADIRKAVLKADDQSIDFDECPDVVVINPEDNWECQESSANQIYIDDKTGEMLVDCDDYELEIHRFSLESLKSIAEAIDMRNEEMEDE